MTPITATALATVTGGAPKQRPPTKESIPGYTPGLPDFAKFPEVARVLKVAPYYKGPDARPFSALRAREILDPSGSSMKAANDFYIDQSGR